MPKLVHNILVTVFEKNENKIQEHKEIFHKLLPVNFEKENVSVSIEAAEGFHQKSIYILRLKTDKKRHNTTLLDVLFSHLNDSDKKRIADQYLSRLNQEGYFFIRLDKQSLQKNEFVLTESGDCYHFKIKLASFPARWEGFVQTAQVLLTKYDCMKIDKTE